MFEHQLSFISKLFWEQSVPIFFALSIVEQDVCLHRANWSLSDFLRLSLDDIILPVLILVSHLVTWDCMSHVILAA